MYSLNTRSTGGVGAAYLETYGMSGEEDLNGRMLDVGAGFSGFVPTLIDQGVDAVALDPKYYCDYDYDEDLAHILKSEEELTLSANSVKAMAEFKKAKRKYSERFIGGTASDTGLEDDTFDYVFSSFAAVTGSLDDIPAATEELRELLRITRHLGVISIYPVIGGAGDIVNTQSSVKLETRTDILARRDVEEQSRIIPKLKTLHEIIATDDISRVVGGAEVSLASFTEAHHGLLLRILVTKK